MRLTKRQLKRIIREEYSRLKRKGLIKESWDDESIGKYADAMSKAYGRSPQGEDTIEKLCNQIYRQEDISWQGYCQNYEDLMMDFRVEMDEEADDFLFTFELEECPASADELCGALRDREVQQHPMFSAYIDMLYGG